jgi:hypothetical protein
MPRIDLRFTMPVSSNSTKEILVMFKRVVLLSLVAVWALGGGLFTSAARTRAQDNMDKVTCDSTVVLLLYTAEHDMDSTP